MLRRMVVLAWTVLGSACLAVGGVLGASVVAAAAAPESVTRAVRAPAAGLVEAPMGSPEIEGTVRPVPGEVVEPFDPPDVPWGTGNRGVKLDADPADPVRAALDGTVRFAGLVARQGWVTVDHGGGLDTTYGVDPAVTVGRRVRAGEVIGTVEDGADRVHWGMRLHGEYVDPLSAFGHWRVRLVPTDGVRPDR